MDDVAELIDQGTSIRELSKHFRTRREAIEYYATHQQARYELANLDDSSCRCGRRTGVVVAAFRWRAILFKRVSFGKLEAALLLLGHLGAKLEHDTVIFITYHPLCLSCWQSLRVCKLVAILLEFAAFALLLIGLFVAPAGIFGAIFLDFKDKELTYRLFMASIGAAGIAMIVLYPFLVSLAFKLRVPTPLRGISRKPFQYAGSSLVDREKVKGSPLILGKPPP